MTLQSINLMVLSSLLQAMNRKYHLSEKQWKRISSFFPQCKGKRGFKAKISNRDAFEAVVYIGRTGTPWRDLPYQYGAWSSIYMRWRRWNSAGIFDKICQELQKDNRELRDMLHIDSTVVRAHQHAAGASKKKAAKPNNVLGVVREAYRQRFTPLLSVKMK